MPAPKPPYPAAFRQQMVELLRAGRGISDLAPECGCNAISIHAWMKAAGGLDGSSATSNALITRKPQGVLHHSDQGSQSRVGQPAPQAQQHRPEIPINFEKGLQDKASATKSAIAELTSAGALKT